MFHLRYDYKIAREYNWNVKNKASKGYEENYFFIFRDGDGVYYNELETRLVIILSWIVLFFMSIYCNKSRLAHKMKFFPEHVGKHVTKRRYFFFRNAAEESNIEK